MPLKKLFSFDSDEIRRPRPQARYLEGRGSYPEMRDTYVEFTQDDYINQDDYIHQDEMVRDEEFGYSHPEEIRYSATTGRTGRRRLPLTTLEALVQIKVNGLSHGI